MTEQENKVETIVHNISSDLTEKIINKLEQNQFTKFIDRIERLEEEKAGLAADIREVYSEAKGQGFDVKVMRQIIKLRKLDPADRAESEFLRDEYKKLVGIEE